MIQFFKTIIFIPLYNLLVLIAGFVPSLAASILFLTIIVRILLYPLNKRAFMSQKALKKIQPDLDRIKKENPDQKIQAQKTMELYKEKGVHPFSGCLPVLIQLPIILSLYYVVLGGLHADSPYLYAGIKFPEQISNMFLGINLLEKSVVLGIFAGIIQHIQIRMSPLHKKDEENKDENPLTRALKVQTMYILPAMVAVFGAFFVPAAISFYWAVSTALTILQEKIIAKNN